MDGTGAAFIDRIFLVQVFVQSPFIQVPAFIQGRFIPILALTQGRFIQVLVFIRDHFNNAYSKSVPVGLFGKPGDKIAVIMAAA